MTTRNVDWEIGRRSPVVVRRPLLIGIAATTLLGSFLLFQIQPLIGKAILPWFGGSPAVWTTSMLFFQSVLVAGYAFVYLGVRHLRPGPRSYAFLAAAVAAAAALPILPGAHWKPLPTDDPTTRVLALLAACVGGPYFLLATTGPTVQEWFARAGGGRSPYRLYALSNVGSLAGLIAYPLAIEPSFDVATQAWLWTFGFGAFVAVASWCAWRLRNYADPVADDASAPSIDKQAVDAAPAAWRDAFAWLALAAAGSTLLLAATNHLCQDIASGPLLWVAPLALYLLTFVIAFDRPGWYRRDLCVLAVIVAVPTALAAEAWFDAIVVPHLALIFFACMLCHGELARHKPPPRRLTAYYLLIAAGGALGGILVGVVAPLVFRRFWEWPISVGGVFGFGAALVCGSMAESRNWSSRRRMVVIVPALLSGTPWIALHYFRSPHDAEVESARNFYGVVSIQVRTTGTYRFVQMNNGSTMHGSQLIIRNERRCVPESYYGYATGIGRLLGDERLTAKPRRVGVVGLGAGTLAAYGKAGDVFRFYEINPIVVEFANKYFTYLRDGAATCETVLGDARLTLEAEPPQQYDVLALDAFTGDSIPTHLLTVEAFDLYLRHLRTDGVLALHVTNRHLDLVPVVAAAAERFGLSGTVVDSLDDPGTAAKTARWILLTRRPEGSAWTRLRTPMTAPLPPSGSVRLWTDGYSNVLSLLQ